MFCIYWCPVSIFRCLAFIGTLFLFSDVLHLLVPCFYFQMYCIYWYPFSIFRCLVSIVPCFYFQMSCIDWCPVSIYRYLAFIDALFYFQMSWCLGSVFRCLVFIGTLFPFSIFTGALFLFSEVLYLLMPCFYFQMSLIYWYPVSISRCLLFNVPCFYFQWSCIYWCPVSIFKMVFFGNKWCARATKQIKNTTQSISSFLYVESAPYTHWSRHKFEPVKNNWQRKYAQIKEFIKLKPLTSKQKRFIFNKCRRKVLKFCWCFDESAFFKITLRNITPFETVFTFVTRHLISWYRLENPWLLYLLVPCFNFQTYCIYWCPVSIFRRLVFISALFLFSDVSYL